MCKGLVADIQRASVHDGPGIRTTVFLKGCPLSCSWCHNPECISFEPEELFYREKCIGCGKCAEGCFSGARVRCGTDMTPEDVLRAVRQDQPYYGLTGGVTLSGGEPLAQPAFSAAVFALCRRENIHCAIETSMFLYDERALAQADLIFADIKVFDPEKHKEFVGADNAGIFENIQKADALGVPIVIRTPIVPGVNDTKENILSTARFVRTLRHAKRYELLPYHPLGISKAQALGKTQTRFETPDKAKMEELRRYADLSGQA